MNKIAKSFIIIGLLLIITSVVMLVHNDYEDIKAGKNSEDALSIIKNNYNEEKDSIIRKENTQKMQTIEVNGNDFIGTIIIPSLKLELPVMSEYNEENLKIAPTRYYGSIYTNDLVICAHSYKTHFKYLSNLKPKDIVIFTDISGVNYIYEVLEVEILNSNDVSKMLDNEFDLTLYTCTTDGINRVTIRCNKISDKML